MVTTQKFKIIVIVILRGGLKNNTATEVLGAIIIHDTFDEEEERSKNVGNKRYMCSAISNKNFCI